MNIEINIKKFTIYLSLNNYKYAYEEFLSIQEADYNLLVKKIFELRLSGQFQLFLDQFNILIKNKNLQSAINRKINIIKIRNLEYFKLANLISSSLKNNNINHVFLKGLALNFKVYFNDLSIREIRDIDILVETKDALKTYKIITSLGFNNPYLNDDQFSIDHEKYCMPTLSKDNLNIEVHYGLGTKKSSTSFYLVRDILRHNTSQLLDKGLPLISNTNNILHLTYHLVTKEYFNPGPIALSDILILLKKHHDKEMLWKKIKKYNLKKEFVLIMHIIKKYACKDDLVLLNNFVKKEYKIDSALIIDCEDLLYQRLIPNESLSIGLEKKALKKITAMLSFIRLSKNNISQSYQVPKSNKFFYFYYLKKIFQMLSIYIKRNLRINAYSKNFELHKLRKVDEFIK